MASSFVNCFEQLPSLPLTWHLTRGPSKRKLIFQVTSYRCHVGGSKGIAMLRYTGTTSTGFLSTTSFGGIGRISSPGFGSLFFRFWAGISRAYLPISDAGHFPESPCTVVGICLVGGLQQKPRVSQPYQGLKRSHCRLIRCNTVDGPNPAPL